MKLPVLAIIVGALLDALASAIFVLGTGKSTTALIPAMIGIPMLIAGILGLKPGRQKVTMHVAAGFALLGFLASAGRLSAVLAKGGFEWGLGTFSLVTMASLTGIFLIVGISSFIAARKARQAALGK